MFEYNFCAVCDINYFWMLLILVLRFEIAIELSNLFFGAFSEIGFFLLLDLLVEEQLVVEIEVTLGNYLEERFAVEIDLVVVRVGLVVDIWVGESACTNMYPFEIISPLSSLPGTVLTP